MSAGAWVDCPTCGGSGLVADYSGGDFNGASECNACVNGQQWRYASGRVAKWKGGPFVGSEPRAAAPTPGETTP